MKKILMLCAAMMAMVAMMQSCFDLFDLPIGPYDGSIVMYPSIEPMNDSIVVDSSVNVTTVRLLLAGSLSDTMFLTISDGSSHPWHDTLTGHVEMDYGPYDWYYHKLFVQYYTKGVSDDDSVVMTCWFGK